MAIQIREAAPEDWPAVAALLAQLGRPDARGTAEEQRHRDLFISYLAQPESVALVAEDEDGVVGFVNVDYRARLNYDRPQGWIPELIVSEQKRGSAIGTALLARAEEIARSHGCWGLALESANWRTDAHRFYKNRGWEQDALAFNKNFEMWVTP